MTANYDDNVTPLLVEMVGEKRPKEYRSSHKTVVLTAASPVSQIAGYDPARREVYINVLDNPIVLSGDISQAADLSNTTGTMTAPNGRLMSVGIDYCIKGQDEMWISTNLYPTRVSFTILREI